MSYVLSVVFLTMSLWLIINSGRVKIFTKMFVCTYLMVALFIFTIIPAKADSPEASSMTGCLKFTNLSDFPQYKIIFIRWGQFYSERTYLGDDIELVQNRCVTLIDPTEETRVGSLFAIKTTDYEQWKQVTAQYVNAKSKRQNDEEYDNYENYTNNTYLPTMQRLTIPSDLTNRDLFPFVDPNSNFISPYDENANFTYEITATITSINSKLNYVVNQRAYVYKNGTRKTVTLVPISTPQSSRPAATPKSTTPAVSPSTPTKPTFSNSTLTKTTSANKITTLIKTTTGLRTNETLTLSGTTSPNAKVTLTIQSNPITVDVAADQTGKWTYILNPKTLKLPLGSHTVTAQATDSKGLKSDSVTLVTFTLKNPPLQTPLKPEKYSLFNLTNYIAAGLILIATFILIEIRLRREARNIL